MTVEFKARNVNEAWALFCNHMDSEAFTKHCTREVRPRGIRTREIRGPVVTTYLHPAECVLFDPVRDCNPFFHVYEALWMIAGRNDVARVKFYSPQMEAYSDDSKTFHGAYGHRWRNYFRPDQLFSLVTLLKRDPDTRRAVLAMWDGDDLLAADEGKDVPCNTTAYFLLREGALHLTVCNRSNDAVWGCYGANAVHFSFLLQLMAAAVGVEVGTYVQVSNSLHVYLEGKAGEVWNRCAARPPALYQNYDYSTYGLKPPSKLTNNWNRFVHEATLLTMPEDGKVGRYEYEEPWVNNVALPLLLAHERYRAGELGAAAEVLGAAAKEQQDAWLYAGAEWLLRRQRARRDLAEIQR